MFKKTLLVAAITFVSNQSYATQFSIGDTLSSPAWTFSETKTTEQQNDNNSGSADQGNNNSNDNSGSADQGNDNSNDNSGSADQGNDNDNDNSGSADQGNDNSNDNSGSADQGNDNSNDNSGSANQGNKDSRYDIAVYGDMSLNVTSCSTVTLTTSYTAADFSIVSTSWDFSTTTDLCNNPSNQAQAIQFTGANNASLTLKVSAAQLMSAVFQSTDAQKNTTVLYSPNLVATTATPS